MTELAFSFGHAAEAYERGRNGYPEAALDVVGVASDAVVLDLAAGTGKLTRQLVPRHASVIAVEPSDAMRALLERIVPDATALAGYAESIQLEDGSVDAVFVGEAFHWFPDGSVDEIARVLRPGGTLAILFNRPDGPVEPPLSEVFEAALERGSLSKPPAQSIASGAWQRELPGPFEALRTGSFPHRVERDRDGLIDMFASWSVVAALSDERRTSLLAELRSLVPAGRYTSPLRAETYWTHLRR